VDLLKAARAEKREELFKVLRAGQPWGEFADISKGWKRKGVDIEISTSS